MKKILIVLYLVGVHVLLVFALAKTDTGRKLMGQPSRMKSALHSINVQTDRVAPKGAAVFLGDSITQRLPGAAVAAMPVNYGIGGQTTLELARHAADYRALDSARVVYLLVGINDLAQDKVPDFDAVLAEIPEGIPLVWTGVLPARDIDGVDAAREKAKRLCAARPLCTFVEPPIVDADLEDGVHLAAGGYRKWIAALRQASP